MKRIHVTGTAGCIESHRHIALAGSGFATVGLGNFHNRKPKTIRCIDSLICGWLPIRETNIDNQATRPNVLAEKAIDAVVHLMGLKAVGDSVTQFLDYYESNAQGTPSLRRAMAKADVYTLAFSSSAAAYGATHTLPVHEGSRAPTSDPRECSKIIVEKALSGLKSSSPRWGFPRLRYFHPVDTPPRGRVREIPNGIPKNLMPYVYEAESE